jgi:hypothetical protein
MREIDFDKEDAFNFQGNEIVLFGKENLVQKTVEEKLLGNEVPGAGLWGTLGWANNDPLDFKGKILFSEFGNEQSAGETGLMVSELKTFIPTITAENKAVERFINLTKVRFKLPEKDEFEINEIPSLRLTLFLGKDEGALVYYEHSEKQKPNDKGVFDETGQFIEFITPEPTDSTFGFDRDRLNYKIPVIPRKKISLGKKKKLQFSTADRKSQFIIKALVFKRDNKQAPENVIKDFAKQINSQIPENEKTETEIMDFSTFSFKYKLWKFDRTSNKFKLTHTPSEISTTAKTLLLIHGTFSNTHKSFEHLITPKSPNTTSFITQLLDQEHYEQVLAFDHPSVWEDARANVRILVDKFFEGLNFGENRLDVIASSRGCIVAECLGMFPSAKNRVELDKVMLFSGNASGYLGNGGSIGTMLSILKLFVDTPQLKLILGIAQFSKKFMLTLMPGLEQLRPESDKLESILAAKQNNKDTVYKSFIADWHKSLLSKNNSSLLGRIAANGLDVSIRLFLGKEHDWVIGCDQQRRYPISAKADQAIEYNSTHGRFFETGFSKPTNVVYDNLIKFIEK